MKNNHNIFWLILLSSIFFLYIQMIVQHGIFFDGLVYGTLAYSLSVGNGTVYDPQISAYYFSHFHEHPTLSIFLESLYFKLLGHGFYIERIYTFTLFLLVLFFLKKFWNNLYTDNEDRKFVWLPILLFLPLPLVFWSFTQNMLETPLTLFTLLSVYFIFLALQTYKLNKQLFLLFIGALFLVAAFFSKGPVGLFPLASPFLYYIATHNISLRKILFLNITLIVFVVSIFTFLFQDTNLYESTVQYINQQVIASLEGHRNTVSNRFVYLLEILKETMPLIIIAFISFILGRKKIKQDTKYLQFGFFFLLVGLSASLPIMLSTKQYGFYLVPSMPFFSLAFSIFIFIYIKYFVNKILNPKFAILFFSLVLLASIAFAFDKIGKYSRDEDRLKDLNLIAKKVGNTKILSSMSSMNDDASLNTYFIRYYTIHLDPNGKHKYLLTYKKETLKKNQQQMYEIIPLNLKLYNLYKLKF